MTLGLCVPCLLAVEIPASLVCIIDGKGDRVATSPRSLMQFVALVRGIKAGENSTYPPDTMFEINQVMTDVEAVTTHHGTAVCTAHLWHVENMWQDWSASVGRRRW